MSEAFDFDAAVVGAGPAGLSAALAFGLACRSVVVADAGPGRNRRALAVHGYLSRDGADPAELRRLGAAEAARYGAEVRRCRARSVRRDGAGFLVDLGGDVVRARRVVLATGVRDRLPPFEGFDAVYGSSAHHCPHCDGWGWRGRAAAVYAPEGGAEYALALTPWTRDVTLLTGGADLPAGDAARLARNGVAVDARPVARLASEGGALRAVEFASGPPLPREVLFFHLGFEQASPLPAAAGCRLDAEGLVAVDADCMTSEPGVYAAGDCTPGPQSVPSAVAEGARAAAAAHLSMRREDTR